MGNPYKGEVSLELDGRVFIIVFSTNALVEAEDALEQPLSWIMENMQRLKVLRGLLWAGLHDRQPELKLRDVGVMIDQLGIAAAMEVVKDGLTKAFPPAEAKTGANP